ncbi:SDR family NAD(P)-dependent oxidoreductase [Halieaceae bacterium IMCC14734]|uniref:SDR family NAD(P)-dependent oxidoreductase n=1 Tax=Candidatus Litorirhabdus singularis TaxID=2518993 RepID=A0ABT3TIX5_9GAMM|nr:SDR family NAD(P)-dependent oxidoreductase [Candidatus Litorirhabdus singularis]MCX2982236.1 SDR family NAD(P)-dependent oxidoreductase [Candidatus Litorirhabdus singularis]
MDSSIFKNHYGPAAVITGASSGIGYAFAQRLAAIGFDLVLVARREDRLQQLKQSLQQYHVKVQLCVADLTTESAVDAVFSACQGMDIGLLVSNAGFGLKGAHQDNDPATMQRMLTVNCNAPMQLSHRFAPQLVARERSGIIITSSVEGLMGFPYSVPYAASKAFTNSLAEGLWGELSPQGVDVLGLCPGSTDTEAHALQGIDQSKLEGMMSATEVASLALENITEGPIYIAGEQNQQMFASITEMPRRDALLMMAQTMQESFK